MSKEVMQQALEAFETLTQYNMVRANIFRRFEPTCTGDYVDLQEFREKAKPAITALQEELAQPDFWEGYVPEPVRPEVCCGEYATCLRACTPRGEWLANKALDKKAENARELGLDYDAKSDHQLMENAKGDVERIQLVQTNVGIGNPEPEFFTHCVDQPYDWSEWVCPDPKSYLFKCCDCGLVHEAEFGVVRYKSETEREDCDRVDDPNLQAVFRMRRSEQWSPADMAHRAGGLTMAQPAPATLWLYWKFNDKGVETGPFKTHSEDEAYGLDCTAQTPLMGYTSPPAQRQPLTDEQKRNLVTNWFAEDWAIKSALGMLEDYEAAHNIKE